MVTVNPSTTPRGGQSTSFLEYPVLSHCNIFGPVSQDHAGMEQFKYAQFEKFKLSTSSPNNCCMLHDGSIVLAKNFLLSPQTSKKYVVCEVFNIAIDFYSAPCPSSLLGIHKVDELSLTTQTRDVSDIKQKMVYISINNVSVVLPLLHFN